MAIWLFIKMIGSGIWGFMKTIPLKIWLVLGAVILAAILVHAYGKHQFVSGQADVQGKWNAAVKAAAIVQAKVEAQQDAISAQVVTKYVDRIQVVREKGAAIIREVPRYVTVKDDASCPIPDGFVRLLNSAAKSEFPNPTPSTDDSSSKSADLTH